MYLLILFGILIICFGFVVMRGAPYVPSHRRQLERAFSELYPLTAQDVVVDLGSGDGVVLHEVAHRGARAIGYELNPLLAMMTRLRFRRSPYVTVHTRDYLLLKELPRDCTLVYAFTTSHSIESIGRKLTEWSTGTTLHFISYGFTLKDKKPLRSVGPMHLYLFENGQ